MNSDIKEIMLLTTQVLPSRMCSRLGLTCKVLVSPKEIPVGFMAIGPITNLKAYESDGSAITNLDTRP